MTQPINANTDQNPIITEDLERIASAHLPWNELRNKTVMVTGGGGFLAAYLIKAILTASRGRNMNTQVTCVARRKISVEKRLSAYVGASDFNIFEHDISQPLPTSFPRADYLIHAASQASPKYYGIDPVGTLMANSIGTMYLLQHAVNTQAERFLFFSSGEVYGVPLNSEQMIAEHDYGYVDPMNVRSCYAESKRMGENMCVSWSHQYGLHTNVVRPFHTYGPGIALDDGRVFADFVADVAAGRNIILKSDGLAIRPFCYIADATIAFLTVLMKGAKAEAYNVGNPHAEISIRDLAVNLTKLFPERNIEACFEAPVDSSSYLKSPIPRSCPSIEKISKLNWAPTTTIEVGFRRTILSVERPYFDN